MPEATNKITDLVDEIAERKESELWDLRDCPCCKAKARVLERENDVVIMCSQWLCRTVEGKTLADAAYLWNQKDFRDK